MPLRDHFRPPVTDFASWEELHGAWPSTIAYRLNALLPPEYRSGVKIQLGSAVEIDVAAFELQNPGGSGNHDPFASALEWKAASPTVLLDTDELTPPEYEVRMYDQRQTRRLVAAVEIVSPRNEDRAEARGAFVSKCHAFLQQEVCVVIVDPVTERSANLLGEQYEYEVLVFDDERERTLVAAVEFVSPANKDRPEPRQAFVTKCAVLLQKGVCVSIVDVVTVRQINLYGELLELIGRSDPALGPEPPHLYTVTLRSRTPPQKRPVLDTWFYPLALGQPLPPLPLWLDADLAGSLDLEGSYEDTCRALRIV